MIFDYDNFNGQKNILEIINFIFTVIAILTVDSWGRRPLLIWGMAVVTFSLGATALALQSNAQSQWIVLLLCIYMACVALSICAVIWVITAEIFPNSIRGRAMSLAALSNWVTDSLSVFVFPWFMDKYGVHTGFFTCATICLATTIFFWAIVRVST